MPDCTPGRQAGAGAPARYDPGILLGGTALPTLAETRQQLHAAGQDHVLRFFDRLAPVQQRALLAQVASLDLESLPRFVETYVKHKPAFSLPADIEPAPYYPFDPANAWRPWDRAAMKRAGEDLIRRGKVAAFVVAGGQGSRLGFDGPKGCYPGGAVTGKPLFQIFAEGIVAARRRYDAAIPWYIMTSPLNHEATVGFFKEHGFFGLPESDVMFFPQGVMPSFDIATGRMLMTSPHEIAANPDGHGGSIRALHVSGALADMKRRGVEHLSYFQVDNPTVRVIDPVFLGLHAAASDSSGEMSSKMVPKVAPEEKVGVFCRVNGKTEVVEYSDLPAALTNARTPGGGLKFLAGSIAIHIIGVAFIEKLATNAEFELPFHRAEKKVPCIDLETGAPINPTSNNGVKLEKFVFDALSRCRASIVMETDRVEEFAPIKNATGVDSVESSRELQTERAARWLERAGVTVPRRSDGKADCVLEISPLTAVYPEDLRAVHPNKHIPRAERLAL